MVTHSGFLPTAFASASTHTNYLIKLLKSGQELCSRQTHNYTCLLLLVNSPRRHARYIFRVCSGLRVPKRGAQYREPVSKVKGFLEKSFTAQLSTVKYRFSPRKTGISGNRGLGRDGSFVGNPRHPAQNK